MCNDDKKTEQVKVHMSERLFMDLSRLAARDDRKLSEYIGIVLNLHVYGHSSKLTENIEGANSPEEGRN